MSERKYSFVVNVPKTEPGAYNPHRPISGLISNQIKHLKEIESQLPQEQQTNIDIGEIRTEGEASDYIGKVTALFHRPKERA